MLNIIFGALIAIFAIFLTTIIGPWAWILSIIGGWMMGKGLAEVLYR